MLGGEAAVLGVVATAGVLLSAYMWLTVETVSIPSTVALDQLSLFPHNNSTMLPTVITEAAHHDYANGTNLFGLTFDPRCFYSASHTFSSDGNDDIVCNPRCPTRGADVTSCGDSYGYSELISLAFVVLCIGGQLKIFVCRVGKRLFFQGARPSWQLLLSSSFCWLVTLVIASTMDSSLGLVTPIDVPMSLDRSVSTTVSVDVAWQRLPPIMVLYACIICALLFLAEDLSKFIFFFIVDRFCRTTRHK